jgi:hypothetical protein
VWAGATRFLRRVTWGFGRAVALAAIKGAFGWMLGLSRRFAGFGDQRTGSFAGPSGETVRLAWLDALRGWAALVVALHHASYYYVPGLRSKMVDWFDPGRYGVLLFFLVSGYIVPVSLERHGDVRRFWIGRFFRIYPLLAVVCAVPVLLALLGVRELREGLIVALFVIGGNRRPVRHRVRRTVATLAGRPGGARGPSSRLPA